MIKKAKQRRQLNLNLPEDLMDQIDQICEEMAYNKTQLVIKALEIYVGIHLEKKVLEHKFPDKRIRSKVLLEALPTDDEQQEKAAFILY